MPDKAIFQLVRYSATSAALLLLAHITVANASSEIASDTQYELPHIEISPVIDGHIEERVWQNALRIELNVETSPGENIPAREETLVYLYEDGETLFVAFDAKDSSPEQIRAFLTDRDNIWSTDFVGIKFDTFNQSRKAFQFFSNALGVQAEAIQEDFVGDDSTWDALWDSAGRLTDTGYQVEMAIPLSSLRFPDNEQGQTWGIEVVRFLPRAKFHRFANAPVNRQIACQICQYPKLVGLRNIKPPKTIELIPTLVIDNQQQRPDPSADDWQKDGIDNRVGLDVRYALTQDIRLNATLNPDFSQVEADDAQLDVNNTFSLFVSEKRPFFLDGADYFSSFFRFIHTRTLIEPDYGLKVTGQTGQHNFGLMQIRDAHTRFVLPGNLRSQTVTLTDTPSDNSALRYNLDLGGKNTLGFTATERKGEDYHNRLTALDGKYWINQQHSVAIQWARSDSHYPQQVFNDYILANNPDADADDLSPSGNALRVDYNFNARNWWGWGRYLRLDEGFRADLGFETRANWEKRVLGFGHRWYNDNADDWWNDWAIFGDWDKTFDDYGRELEEESEINFSLSALMQSKTELKIGKRNRFFNQVYFDETFYRLKSELSPNEQLKLYFEIDWGDEIDFENTRLGDNLTLQSKAEWQLGVHWQIKAEYIRQLFDVSGGRLFAATIANLRLTYQFDARSYLRLTRQQTHVKRNPSLYLNPIDQLSQFQGLQLLYAYKVNPRTLFFAGYNDAGFRDDSLPRIEKTGRNLFMKFSYSWQI